MLCKDLFALGVRLFGIWLIMRGLLYVESFADMKLYPASDKARDSAAANLIYATFDLGLAAFFLLWTRVIVVWTYGEEPEINQQREAEGENGAGGRTDEPGELEHV